MGPVHLDRIIVAPGIFQTINQPKVKGIEKFAGEAIHSREFKDPTKYKGTNVVVVGVGATGADTTSFLVKAGAEKVYLSHRSQYFLVSTPILESDVYLGIEQLDSYPVSCMARPLTIP